MPSRLVCNFSCGAASAVATALALRENAAGARLPTEVVYFHVKEEHPDNLRFLKDCERWFDHPIQILEAEKYGGSIYAVFREKKFLVGPSFTPCSKHLKKEVAEAFQRPGDILVLGYTSEEEDRANRWIDANNERDAWFPLLGRGIDKAACLAIVQHAGIKLPEMYHLGYQNANCIGCVRGGIGYWNKIRRDFPAVFIATARLERELGATIVRYTVGGVRQRVYLDELPADAGRDVQEILPDCGPFCVLVESAAQIKTARVSRAAPSTTTMEHPRNRTTQL